MLCLRVKPALAAVFALLALGFALAGPARADTPPQPVPEECLYDEYGEPIVGDDGLCITEPGDVYWGEPGEPPPSTPPEPTAPTGPVARIGTDGRRAVAPKGVPKIVKRAIDAANRLTRKPYKWGGGHARLNDRGYDCSGAVSYVLRAIKRVEGAPVSGSLRRWGLPGEGKWITVYTNKRHVFMVIAGLRFDTSGYGERGPRWRAETRPFDGFAVRHPFGL